MAESRPDSALDNHSTVVFLGPSLPVASARDMLPATYLPPVRCGDLLRCLRLRPRRIAVIDGLFESTAAVWHKEILLAMEQGVRVYGASSMGALRAAELAPFGMVGVGAIFESFHRGELNDDDEVAVLHGPERIGSPVITDAMVNIRATLTRARELGILTQASADLLLRNAKDCFYWQRRIPDLVQQLIETHGQLESELLGFLHWCTEDAGYVDQKRRDAQALLELLAADVNDDDAGRRDLELAEETRRSAFLRTLQLNLSSRPFPSPVSGLPTRERVAQQARLLGTGYLRIRRLAQFLGLAYQLSGQELNAQIAEVAVPEVPMAIAPLGLPSLDQAWALKHDCDPAEALALYRRLLAVLSLRESLASQLGARYTRYEDENRLALLRLFGVYEDLNRSGTSGAGDTSPTTARSESFFRLLALLWTLIDHHASERGFAANQTSTQALSDEFRAAHGLHSAQATQEWLERNDISMTEYAELIETYGRMSLLCDNDNSHALGLEGQMDPTSFLLYDALCISGCYQALRDAGTGARQPLELLDSESVRGLSPSLQEQLARSLDFPGGAPDLLEALGALESLHSMAEPIPGVAAETG